MGVSLCGDPHDPAAWIHLWSVKICVLILTRRPEGWPRVGFVGGHVDEAGACKLGCLQGTHPGTDRLGSDEKGRLVHCGLSDDQKDPSVALSDDRTRLINPLPAGHWMSDSGSYPEHVDLDVDARACPGATAQGVLFLSAWAVQLRGRGGYLGSGARRRKCTPCRSFQGTVTLLTPPYGTCVL